MNDTRYDLEPDFDDYDSYADSQVTGVGLPLSQLLLIIGVNAVVSLIISVGVVLIANREVVPGTVAIPAAAGDLTAEAVNQTGDSATVSLEETAAAVVPTQSTPIQTLVYEVKAGDTLSLIADKFSVSLFDLMTANGLSNQDFIQIGQELTIPVGGLPTGTPTFTVVPIPTETPLPFEPPTPLPEDADVPPEPAATVGPSPTPSDTATPSGDTLASLSTSTPAPFDEINVSITQILGAGTLADETVVILNQGAGTSLLDWRLEGSSLANFTFPDIFLFSGGSIRVHTSAGQNTPSDLFLNQGEAAWPPGTTIILRDAAGNEISVYTVPPS
ncbi:MAG: LysM peptidoglycan-binding domain-containing protein [Anaerolineae bacterium]|nr:LysM peptidoglycan-binding domain-containing protein [Anaerolineae bacterium]MCB0180301.1 LysM peptidoglycan-binding domain-containing protein [Anaerolineae bacterium]MCB0224889.1 LysM peptidoglycan-binding domain-containing protein [Anaerolineae bacterium]MCB9108103.1 LysM peptidoglycan-binding domain-containing protein [Anaerolineales bacterium]